MSLIEALSIIVTGLVIPYVVALIKSNTISGNKARWLAIALSVIAGIIAGLVGGIPTDPGSWIVCIGLAIAATQVAYTIFKSAGITSNWLEALMSIRKDEDDPALKAKHAAMGAESEEARDAQD